MAVKAHRNLKIMLLIASATFAVSAYFQIEKWEWITVILCSGFVISLEIINSSIEEILDHLHPDFHQKIGRAKDIAAGAVIFACMIAGLCGAIIFLPRLL